MPTFLSDSFTDTDGTTLQSHTGETGATWTEHAGGDTSLTDLLIQSNRAQQDTANAKTALYYSSGVPATAEYDVTGVVHRVAASLESALGPALRLDTVAVTFYHLRYSTASLAWQLYRFVAGAATLLGSWAETIPNGESRAFEVRIRDPDASTVNIVVDIEGVERINVDDTHADRITAAGRVGIRGRNDAAASDVAIDSLIASDPATATAALSGTAGDGATEAEIVAGGETIVLTLTGDTWVTAGATFDAQRQAIIDGLDSDGAQANGWDAERSNIPVSAVVRTSDTVVTITLPALGNYIISADETITATIPATAVAGGAAITAEPTFTITASGPVAGKSIGALIGFGEF